MNGVSVPSRMYNIMAAGVPIIAIADRDSELAQVVCENDAGWHLEPGDAEGLEKLGRHVASPTGQLEARAKGVNAREAVCKKYTFDRVIGLYQYHLLESYG